MSDPHAPHADHSKHYIKIWIALLVLLMVSLVPAIIAQQLHLNITGIVVVTAFAVAFIKAYLVIKHFMHLTIEKKYVGFLFLTMLAFMLVFVGGVSPDVMKHEGQRWTNDAAKKVVDEGMKAEKAGGHGEPEKH
ncbi:MAG: cytochrome C oxidase subunit IV family protein [Archangium sp.]|nr:cytochrome C oxidase subunit IV family protein [Archangium sp.]